MVGMSPWNLALLGLASVSFASPIIQNDEVLEKRAPEYCLSGGFSNLAGVLRSKSATPFCSQFLQIATVSVPATETLQTYTTLTNTVDQYTSTTQTVLTKTLSFTVTTTINTLPTTVATNTVISVSIFTSLVTPPSQTVTTTVWYTPGPRKERRADAVPPYLAGFASNAISSGCSCLDIPTPTTTITATTYNPNTIQTQVTKTVTNTIDATLTVSSTSTIRTTFYVPVTSVTTRVIPSVFTSTLPTPTKTVTISSAFRPQCTNLLGKPKLYTAIQPQRSYSYPFATTLIPIGNLNGDEPTFSWCCELCYKSENCGQFYTYRARLNEWRCQIITSYTQVNVGISQICPLGRLNNEGVSGPAAWVAGNQARGIGPCYGYTVPL